MSYNYQDQPSESQSEWLGKEKKQTKKHTQGEWVYDQYTPDWVKPLIHTKCGIEIVTMDQANHPLRKEKMNYNLNTVRQWGRHPDYPFWVSWQDIDSAIFSTFELGNIMSKEDFSDVIKDRQRPVYIYFCSMWYNTIDTHVYKEEREALILASMGL